MRMYGDILTAILKEKFIGIIRTNVEETARRGAEAMIAGGATVLEITLNTPGALSVISALQDRDAVLIGAGTVLDEVSCRLAILNGAEFIVTPTLDEGVIACANLYQKPVICGCYTPTEIAHAMRLGVHLIKWFPANQCKPDVIAAIHGPLPQISIGPTGGVNLDNIRDWKKNGAAFFCVSGELSRLAQEGSYDELTERVKTYRQAVSE